MARLHRWMLPLLSLTLGACTELPNEVETLTSSSGPDTSASSGSSGGLGPTTSTTTSATQGSASTTLPTTATVTTVDPDTTDGTTDDTTDDDDSSGSGSGSSTTGPSCINDDDCGPYAVCDNGDCESICPGGWGQGSYQGCLNELGGYAIPDLCGGSPPDVTCAYWGNPIQATACTTQECTTACDCPEPPPTGNATVTCGNLIVDSDDDCYLSCASGETCPDGMTCISETYCATQPEPLPMYGDCDAIAAGCDEGLSCVYIMGSYSMCFSSCSNAGDCDSPPAEAAFAAGCGLYTPDFSGEECVIPCGIDDDCPYIMQCVNNSFCAWPL